MTNALLTSRPPVETTEQRSSTSIYRQALGTDFDRLHPRMKERFGFSSGDGVAHVGRGIMTSIRRKSRLARPLLHLFARRNLLFPDTGTNIPFSVANYAYTDSFGRETVTWHRTFEFARRSRIFDATMIYNQNLGTIVDYLGTHQQVAAELHSWVDDDGGMNFTSMEQRLYVGPFGFRIPSALTGQAHVREWWDEAAEVYRIDVHVTNPLLGTIVHYQGHFALDIMEIPQELVPSTVRPVREEPRD